MLILICTAHIRAVISHDRPVSVELRTHGATEILMINDDVFSHDECTGLGLCDIGADANSISSL